MTAAWRLLEAGEPFSLRAVTRMAGVSPASSYRHFPDRPHLEAAVGARGFHALETRLRSAVSGPHATLSDLGAAYVAFAVERPALFRMMFAEVDDRDERATAKAGLVALISDAVARLGGLGADTSGEVTRDFLVKGVWGLSHGLAMLQIEGLSPDRGPPSAVPDDREIQAVFSALAAGLVRSATRWPDQPGTR